MKKLIIAILALSFMQAWTTDVFKLNLWIMTIGFHNGNYNIYMYSRTLNSRCLQYDFKELNTLFNFGSVWEIFNKCKKKSTYIIWRKCLIFKVGPPGLEPGTTWLWVRCSNQLSYEPKTTWFLMDSTGLRISTANHNRGTNLINIQRFQCFYNGQNVIKILITKQILKIFNYCGVYFWINRCNGLTCTL